MAGAAMRGAGVGVATADGSSAAVAACAGAGMSPVTADRDGAMRAGQCGGSLQQWLAHSAERRYWPAEIVRPAFELRVPLPIASPDAEPRGAGLLLCRQEFRRRIRCRAGTTA
jgi:hypothetical protein